MDPSNFNPLPPMPEAPVIAPTWVEQMWIKPVVCTQCTKPIPAETKYYRLSFELDGPDKDGRDVCAKCSKTGVK